MAPLQALIEPLLLRFRVDLALWGHHHSYQRSCPMARGQCATEVYPMGEQRSAGKMEAGQSGGSEEGHHHRKIASGWRGVTHAVIGTAGYEFSPIPSGASLPAWVKFANNATYGYAAINANRTRLHFEFIRADGRGHLDEFALWR